MPSRQVRTSSEIVNRPLVRRIIHPPLCGGLSRVVRVWRDVWRHMTGVVWRHVSGGRGNVGVKVGTRVWPVWRRRRKYAPWNRHKGRLAIRGVNRSSEILGLRNVPNRFGLRSVIRHFRGQFLDRTLVKVNFTHFLTLWVYRAQNRNDIVMFVFLCTSA